MHEKSVAIVRTGSGQDGTFGRLILPTPESLVCVEPPWKDNRTDLSCIPPGSYECEVNESPRFGLCVEILNVPDRTHIRMHKGNFAGDVEAGLKSDTEGCILPGLHYASLKGQRVVSSSVTAFKRLLDVVCDGDPRPGVRFNLEIIDVTGKAGRGWR